jgi:ATP-dependent Clp protease adapter protein ClpS/Zn-dependent protease
MSPTLRLAGFPVTVEPAFFLVSVLTAWGDWQHGLPWVLVVFVSVLAHEFGHAAAAARLAGASPTIELVAFGGVTRWTAGPEGVSWRQRIAISLAGPAAGFTLGAFVFAVAEGARLRHLTVVKQLLWVNIGWTLVNLLPMLPLDGGNVLAALVERDRAGRGRVVVQVISALVATPLLLFGLKRDMPILSVLAGYALVENVGAVYERSAARRDERWSSQLNRALERIQDGDADRVIAELGALLPLLRSKAAGARAAEFLAWANLAVGDKEGARAAVLWMPAGWSPSTSLAEQIALPAPPRRRRDGEWTKPGTRFPGGRAALRLHNDDDTPMDFVVDVLREELHFDDERANALMLEVHERGGARLGVYPQHDAHTLARAIRTRAEAAGYPLLCTLEAE